MDLPTRKVFTPTTRRNAATAYHTAMLVWPFLKNPMGDGRFWLVSDIVVSLRVHHPWLAVAFGGLSGITPDSIKARGSWDNVDAVKNNKIYEVNEALITIWGPRIVNGLEELAQVIHPEVFNATADS